MEACRMLPLTCLLFTIAEHYEGFIEWKSETAIVVHLLAALVYDSVVFSLLLTAVL